MSAYARGRIVTPPPIFDELIVIPAVLHTPWGMFDSYPPALQAMTRALLPHWLAGGQGMNPDVIHAE